MESRPGWRATLALLGVVLCARPLTAATLGPEDTLKRYLQAVKDTKFEVAYELISRAMRGGKDRDAYVKEQKEGMSWADVKIFSFEVGSGKIEGDKAFVPNVLASQDKFVNQLGLTEYELYTLVKEDGAWKVDQQVIVEPPDIPRWFPQAKKDAAGAPSSSPPAAAAPAGGGSPTSH